MQAAHDQPARRAAQPLPRPDYRGGSIVNLMTTIVDGLGGAPSPYPALRGLDGDIGTAVRNVVLLVVDGLGYHYLERAEHARALRHHLRGPITSVFPPTTATAITSFLTATAPQQHGLTGWFTNFTEAGGVVTTLRLTMRQDEASLAARGIEPATLFTAPGVFDRIEADGFVVSPRQIAHSPYNAFHAGRAAIRPYRSLAQLFAVTASIVRSGHGRQYVYAYWPELDRLGHEYGIESRRARSHLIEIDAAFGRFLETIAGTDSIVIVTADHGVVDCGPRNRLELSDHAALADTLALPLCGDGRTAYCYVRPERQVDFADVAAEALGDRAHVATSEALIEDGYFGLGDPHPRLAERVGDFTLLMRGRHTIKDWLPGERRYVHVGAHGGLSEEELFVPLVVARP